MTGEIVQEERGPARRQHEALIDFTFEQCEKMFELQCQLELEKRRIAAAKKFGPDKLDLTFSSSPDLSGLIDLFQLNKTNGVKEKKPTYKTTVFADIDDDLELFEMDDDVKIDLNGDWCNDRKHSMCRHFETPISVLPTLRSSSGPDYDAIVHENTCNARRSLQHPAAAIGLKH
uniref:Uncharacterized protein n=1 Tax=Panagrolaimus sp. JU765 TaxID=591449 RepID=A0AC34REH5_9BILA